MPAQRIEDGDPMPGPPHSTTHQFNEKLTGTRP
ncbi:hypothetical protein FHR47_002949 [Xanthomonas arboricola]|nr:hypothetical protein [Xanthomonas cannabis]MBB3805890.1 hypothetical protein [Xanthomonas cannabis]NIK17559.1 hypothetical protein [Xanthomonas cannabis]